MLGFTRDSRRLARGSVSAKLLAIAQEAVGMGILLAVLTLGFGARLWTLFPGVLAAARVFLA